MPLIPVAFEAHMRRHWQVVLAVVLCVLFMAVHVVLFGGAARSYERAMRRAGDLGLAANPVQPLLVTPPRVLVLLAANMLPPTVTDVNRQSADLASSMLEKVTQLTQKHDMRVLVTDPGLTSQDARSVQIRAHLRLECTYLQFVAFLDEMAQDPSLISVDRFTLIRNREGREQLDVWLTLFALKPGKTP